MKLTRKQQRILKSLLKDYSVAEIAEKISVPEDKIYEYLKTHWRKDKFERLSPRQSGGEFFDHTPAVTAAEFSFLGFLKKNWVFILLLIVSVPALYLNGLSNNFISDDISGIVENRNIGSIESALQYPPSVLWPLTQVLTYKIDGLNTVPFRIVNIMFHTANVFLVFMILNLITRRSVAIIAAFLFATHPILTESVVWISGGVYAFYSIFVLLGLFLYILYDRRGKTRYLVATFVTYIVALMISERAAVLPLLLTLYTISFSDIKKKWKSLIPFYLLTFVFIYVIFGGLVKRAETLQSQYYQYSGFVNPFKIIPFTVAKFLQLLFIPIGLTFYHSEFITEGPIFAGAIAVFFALLGFIAFMYYRSKFLFFILSFFLIGISPTLVPVAISSFLAERYVYLGSIGIIVFIAVVIDSISKKAGEYAKQVSVIVTVFFVILFSYLTIERNSQWRDEPALAESAAKYSPSSHQNLLNLGVVADREKRYEDAIEYFKQAIEVKQDYGDAYLNLGNSYKNIGKIEEAVENYEKALALNPNVWQANFGLAVIAYEKQDMPEAKNQLEKAVAIKDDDPQMLNNLAVISLQLGEIDRAKELLTKSLELKPGDENVQELLDSLSNEAPMPLEVREE